MTKSPQTEQPKDISREGLTWAKITQPLRLLRPQNNHAIAKLERFENLDIAQLQEETWKEIKGIILDVDECIAPHHGEILPQNIQKLRELTAAGIKVIIFSNMKYSERYAELEEMGIEIHQSAYPKPDKRGFLECCEKLGLPPEEIIMIGDNLITDGGSIRAGINLVLVDPIQTEEENPSFGRRVQIATRDYFSDLSDQHDAKLGRDVV